MHEQTFDALVGDFYRAATGAIEWSDAMANVQLAFGARATMLHTLDLADGRLIGISHGGSDLDEAMLAYIRDFHAIDPRRNHVISLGEQGIGKWLHCNEIFDDGFVAQDRFFQHFLPAYQTRYCAICTIPIEGSVITAFAFELPAARGPMNAEERVIARRLGDHLRDALRAWQRTRALMQQALAGHGLLRNFPYPMWLLDETRFIAFENAAAVAEVEQGGGRVARRNGCLVLTRGTTDLRLIEALEQLRSAGHGASVAADLRTTAADPPAWLHLSLLVPDAVLGAFGRRHQVLATLFDPTSVSAIDPFALSNLFGLTPTEARVAVHLAEGLTAESIGQLHGTALSTVRTQIRQVIAKLGAQRTVDVVRMLRQGEALWAAPRISGGR